jgi:RNA polymerase sigma-70 factor (ECF subfamily)
MRSNLEESIALLRKGDPPSVERALELLQRAVLSFGIKVCGHREDAEDTAQDVLMRSLPHLSKLQDPRALSVWLYKAAKNRCWEGRRALSRQRTVALGQLLPDGAEVESLLLADSSAGPEEVAVGRQVNYLLRSAILALPSQYRIVLVLHDMEELDSDVVAEILSIKPGTVRVRLHRARLLIRREMARLLRGIPEPDQRRKVARTRSADCRRIFANLSEYLDGRLAPANCESMRKHIEACPSCVAFIEDLKRAIDRCRSLEVVPDGETQPVLRRLLTEEYLRLKNSSPNL